MKKIGKKVLFTSFIFIAVGLTLYRFFRSSQSQIDDLEDAFDLFKNNPISKKSSKKTSKRKSVAPKNFKENKIKSVEEKSMDIKKNTGSMSGLNQRQRRLLELAKREGSVNMSTAAKKFPEVTTRTLRRDFEKLEGAGHLVQQGKTRDSVYVLKA